jgi:hypothetical protein
VRVWLAWELRGVGEGGGGFPSFLSFLLSEPGSASMPDLLGCRRELRKTINFLDIRQSPIQKAIRSIFRNGIGGQSPAGLDLPGPRWNGPASRVPSSLKGGGSVGCGAAKAGLGPSLTLLSIGGNAKPTFAMSIGSPGRDLFSL